MHTEKKKLICVVGESCSGKDTIVKEATSYLTYGRTTNIRLKPIVSYATRPIRENETNGVEHWFITENEAKEITGKNNEAVTQEKTGPRGLPSLPPQRNQGASA